MAAQLAYIGNFSVEYSTESHVALALEALGATVHRVPEKDLDWRWVAVHAKANNLDFVLWTHTHGFADESKHDECMGYLKDMREVGVPTIGLHLDRWWGLEREDQVHEPFFKQDVVFTADGGHAEQWEAIGVEHVWLPPAVVHTEVGRGTPQGEYVCDIGFVGSWRDYGHAALWPWRKQMILELHRRYGPDRFKQWPRGHAVRGLELNDAYASMRVVAGDSCLAPAHGGEPMRRYWSDRVPETLGRGGLLVHPFVEGITQAFPRLRTYTAGDPFSLIAAVEAALELTDVERSEEIDAHVEHVREHHTYLNRMRVVLDAAEAIR